MCGHARLSSDVSEIAIAFGMPPERPTPNFAARWNVAPTDLLPSVRDDATDHRRRLQGRRWGLVPFWVKDIKAGFANINAKTAGVALARQPDRWGTTTRACPQRQPSSTPRLLVGRP
jgi:putative SOS response-associated peptidase YedK